MHSIKNNLRFTMPKSSRNKTKYVRTTGGFTLCGNHMETTIASTKGSLRPTCRRRRCPCILSLSRKITLRKSWVTGYAWRNCRGTGRGVWGGKSCGLVRTRFLFTFRGESPSHERRRSIRDHRLNNGKLLRRT